MWASPEDENIVRGGPKISSSLSLAELGSRRVILIMTENVGDS